MEYLKLWPVWWGKQIVDCNSKAINLRRHCTCWAKPKNSNYMWLLFPYKFGGVVWILKQLSFVDGVCQLLVEAGNLRKPTGPVANYLLNDHVSFCLSVFLNKQASTFVFSIGCYRNVYVKVSNTCCPHLEMELLLYEWCTRLDRMDTIYALVLHKRPMSHIVASSLHTS